MNLLPPLVILLFKGVMNKGASSYHLSHNYALLSLSFKNYAMVSFCFEKKSIGTKVRGMPSDQGVTCLGRLAVCRSLAKIRSKVCALSSPRA